MSLTVQDLSTFRLFGIIDNIRTQVSEPVIGSVGFIKLRTNQEFSLTLSIPGGGGGFLDPPSENPE